ncbi:Solute carrier family 35 member F6 [Nymphon striatum]|nr:Solute carrier family 35 member F6 [Nymphon striatum]
MAWTTYQLFLAGLMVITGSINTLTTKWADRTPSEGKDKTIRKFDHPFLQACSMFLGEFSCMIAYKVMISIYKRKNRDMADMKADLPPSVAGNNKFNPLIFLPPALCDMLGTSTMYIGLNLTYASSFQMLRGAVIIFTGLLSVAFLGRKLKWYEWTGICTVVVGLVVVGVSDIISGSNSTNDMNSILTVHMQAGDCLTDYLKYFNNVVNCNQWGDQRAAAILKPLLGDLLIIIAQIIVGTQMVYEEKFISKHNVPPLQAVGWEGFFGFSILAILLVPMYYIPVGHVLFHNPDGNMEDAIDGFYQIGNNWQVALAFCGTIVSIAFFNFAGISVTKEISATTRMVLDSVRTIIIWIVSLAIDWQQFHPLQLLGFFVLIIGMCLYNDIFILPFMRKCGWIESGPDLQPIMEDAYNPDITEVDEKSSNQKNQLPIDQRNINV